MKTITSYANKEDLETLINAGFTATDLRLHFDEKENFSKIARDAGLKMIYNKNSSKSDIANARLSFGISESLKLDTYLVMVGAKDQVEVRRKHNIPTSASAKVFGSIDDHYKKFVAGSKGNSKSEYDVEFHSDLSPERLLRAMLKHSVSVSTLARVCEVDQQSVREFLCSCESLSDEPVIANTSIEEIVSSCKDELLDIVERVKANELLYGDVPTTFIFSENLLRQCLKQVLPSEADYKDFYKSASKESHRVNNINKYGVENVWSKGSPIVEKMNKEKENRLVSARRIVSAPLPDWSELSQDKELFYDLAVGNCFTHNDFREIYKVSSEEVKNAFSDVKRPRLNKKTVGDREERHFKRISESVSVDEFQRDASFLASEAFYRKYALPKKLMSRIGPRMTSDYDQRRMSCKARQRGLVSDTIQSRLAETRSHEAFYAAYTSVFGEPVSDVELVKTLDDIKRSREQYGLDKILRAFVQITGKPDSFPNSEVLSLLHVTVTYATARRLERMGLMTIDYSLLKESRYEKRTRELIELLGVEFDANRRDLLADSEQEVDFYIPSRKLAIEISPSASHHSNEFASTSHFGPKPTDYHYNKFVNAQKSGLTLIQLFDYDLSDAVWENDTKPMLENLIAGCIKALLSSDVSLISIDDENCSDHRRFALTHEDETVCEFSLRQRDDCGVIELFDIRQDWSVSFVDLFDTMKDAIYQAFGVETSFTLSAHSECSKPVPSLISALDFRFESETGPSLRFINYLDGSDVLSWSVATPWSAKSGVIASDCERKGIDFDSLGISPREYVETRLSHRTDSEEGYTAVFTPGSKKWLMTFDKDS